MYDYSKLEGIFAPIVTPFYEDESIDLQSLKANIRIYNGTGLRGYMPLGSNGEFQSLTDEESARVLDAVMDSASDDRIIVGGCGRESAIRTVQTIRLYYGHGLDLAFILPPHYFARSFTEKNLENYYLKIAEESPIPIVIYNAPKFSAGLDLTPEFIARLAEHENIVALKNSSTLPDEDYIKAVEGLDFRIIAGSINKLYPSLEAGAVGGVISTASYLPEPCLEIYDLFKAGRKDESEALWKKTAEISRKGCGSMYVPGVKLGMTLRGMYGGHVRNPLYDATEEQKAAVVRLFKDNNIGPMKRSD